jgi:hypothetical protein
MVIDGRVGLPRGLARQLAAGLDREVSAERQLIDPATAQDVA